MSDEIQTLLDDVTVKVTIECTKKTAGSWEQNTIAKVTIEDVSSVAFDELAGKISSVINDAEARAQIQLNNTRRIKTLQHQNKLLAENPNA